MQINFRSAFRNEKGVLCVPLKDVRRMMQHAEFPVYCGKCHFNAGIATGFNPQDIVCTFWGTDGLCSDDYCSQGEKYHGG